MLRLERPAAAKAHAAFTFLEAVGNGDAMIEHKTFAFPFTFLGGCLLQVVQNATLQVIHLFESMFQ